MPLLRVVVADDVMCARVVPRLRCPSSPEAVHLSHDQAAVQLQEWTDVLSDVTGVDRTAIWQWAFIERVSTGLHLMELDMKKQGLMFLGVADRLAQALQS